MTSVQKLRDKMARALYALGDRVFPEMVIDDRDVRNAVRQSLPDLPFTITISAHDETGKTTMAKLLRDLVFAQQPGKNDPGLVEKEDPGRVVVEKCANPIYDMVKLVTVNTDVDKAMGYTLGLYNETDPWPARTLLRLFGTEVARHRFSREILPGALCRRLIRDGYKRTDWCIIDDVRYPDEVCLLSDFHIHLHVHRDKNSAGPKIAHRTQKYMDRLRDLADVTMIRGEHDYNWHPSVLNLIGVRLGWIRADDHVNALCEAMGGVIDAQRGVVTFGARTEKTGQQ